MADVLKYLTHYVIILRNNCLTNLSQHDEAHEERDNRHCQNEELSAVLTSEDGRVHVHHGRHEAFYTHKLIRRRKQQLYYFSTVMSFCVTSHLTVQAKKDNHDKETAGP